MRERSVFINCPFDKNYKPFLHRIIFAVIDCGFKARSAIETYDSGATRFNRILKLIQDTKYSVHDISRVELDKHNKLPRFNMPFELGLCMGAKNFGKNYAQNDILVLDGHRYRH